MPVWQNQFRAWVTVDGETANEFEVQTDELGKTVTCWIRSEAGKSFSVSWQNLSYTGASDGKVFVDGVLCGGKIIRSAVKLPTTRRKSGLTNGTTIKHFLFSDIQTTDDDTLPDDATDFTRLGVIKLAIYPVVVGGEIPGGSALLPQVTLHESLVSTADVMQQVLLGVEEPLKRPQPILRTCKTGPALVTFCFKYRPLDHLPANRIAPKKRFFSEMSEPTAILQASLFQNANTKIPQNDAFIDLTLDDTPEPPRKKAKCAADAYCGVLSGWQRGEVIDLT
ncbi:hypothetical protein MIND_00106000 [Mycena indigotica]|uniref:DUF7918 domain-containing protein n=1 Tax=Mycena indigotica TaxID=2126181 RepID=A0A8H6WKM8_9AGAR|nr:uncharacterized protein MIND_00106000 [Mycena indigotica]KAF7315894.1 hypothetical protein MIND_00106000 [Mycena indigotica]